MKIMLNVLHIDPCKLHCILIPLNLVLHVSHQNICRIDKKNIFTSMWTWQVNLNSILSMIALRNPWSIVLDFLTVKLQVKSLNICLKQTIFPHRTNGTQRSNIELRPTKRQPESQGMRRRWVLEGTKFFPVETCPEDGTREITCLPNSHTRLLLVYDRKVTRPLLAIRTNFAGLAS